MSLDTVRSLLICVMVMGALHEKSAGLVLPQGDSNRLIVDTEKGLYLFPISMGERTGYINGSGVVVIAPKYLDGGFFNEGVACVTVGKSLIGDANTKTLFIDVAGKVVIEPNGLASGFHEGMARVYYPSGVSTRLFTTVGKFGYIDRSGRLVMPAKFDMCLDFSEGLAAVQVGNEWGYIDKKGGYVVRPSFVRAESFREGLAVVGIGGAGVPSSIAEKCGFIDRRGRVRIQPVFDDAGQGFSEGLAPVSQGGKWGYIDANGTFVIKPVYERAYLFTEGMGCVATGGGDTSIFGFIDKTGAFVIRPRFEHVEVFSEGMAAVQVGGKWGFVDKKGDYVILPRFANAGLFTEGVAYVGVKKGSEIVRGCINTKGEWIWDPGKEEKNAPTSRQVEEPASREP
jgi:hypothetical protein